MEALRLQGIFALTNKAWAESTYPAGDLALRPTNPRSSLNVKSPARASDIQTERGGEPIVRTSLASGCFAGVAQW